MRSISSRLAAALAVAAAVAGCVVAPPPPPQRPMPPRPWPPGPVRPVPPPMAPMPMCDASGAQFALGRPFSPQLEAAVRARSNARFVRVVWPGQPVTMDFDPTRLTVEVGPRNRVRAVRCG